MLAPVRPGTSRSSSTQGVSISYRASSVAGSVSRREREDEPVDAALREHAHVLGVELRVALGVGEQHRVALLPQPPLGALDRLGEHRVRDVADHEADRVGRPAAQSLRQQVGPVAERIDRREHPLAHRGRHVRMLGEHPRDRAHRHLRAIGHLAHVGAPALWTGAFGVRGTHLLSNATRSVSSMCVRALPSPTLVLRPPFEGSLQWSDSASRSRSGRAPRPSTRSATTRSGPSSSPRSRTRESQTTPCSAAEPRSSRTASASRTRQTAFAKVGAHEANARWSEWFEDIIVSLTGPDGKLVDYAEVWHLD